MYVKAISHCDFSPEETLLAVKVLLERLDTGKWPSTDPRELNNKIKSLSADSKTRFMTPGKWEVLKYNRTWRLTNSN